MNNLDFFKNLYITFSNEVSNRVMMFGRYSGGDIPCYFANLGDNVYNTESGELTSRVDTKSEKVPRVVFLVESINFDNGARSLGNQESSYNIDIEGFQSKKIRDVKPIGFTSEIGATVTLSDFLQSLQFVQYLQESFRNQTFVFRFKYDGMICEANCFVDLSSLDIKTNTDFSEDYESMYPTIEIKFSVTGKYPNFGYYDLSNGGHGYNGYNKDGVITFIGGGDIDSNNKVKTVITKLKDSESGNLIDESIITD